MYYKIIFSVFVSITFSQNLLCSAKKRVRFDVVDAETVTTNFTNVVANTQEVKQYFFETRAQYIEENYISNQANIVMKQSMKKATSEKSIAGLQACGFENEYYCLCLQHPACVTWNVKVFIKK